jgi:hypothetical protein
MATGRGNCTQLGAGTLYFSHSGLGLGLVVVHHQIGQVFKRLMLGPDQSSFVETYVHGAQFFERRALLGTE